MPELIAELIIELIVSCASLKPNESKSFLQTLPNEKKKKIFGKKLSFTKAKDRSGSEDALNADDCKYQGGIGGLV